MRDEPGQEFDRAAPNLAIKTAAMPPTTSSMTNAPMIEDDGKPSKTRLTTRETPYMLNTTAPVSSAARMKLVITAPQIMTTPEARSRPPGALISDIIFGSVPSVVEAVGYPDECDAIAREAILSLSSGPLERIFTTDALGERLISRLLALKLAGRDAAKDVRPLQTWVNENMGII